MAQDKARDKQQRQLRWIGAEMVRFSRGSALALVLLCGCGAIDRTGRQGQDDSDVPIDAASDGSPTDVDLGMLDARGRDDGLRRADAGVTTGDADIIYPPCKQGCEVSVRTDCPKKSTLFTCIDECMTAIASACGNVFRALIDCVATKPLDAYECDILGKSALKPRICAEQVTAVQACVARSRRSAHGPTM